jgi:Sap-like sulfolipid-1-addressing protein
MWSAVLALSLVVALDPIRIGITALLISRPRPMLNLFVFWFGGMAAGLSVAVIALLVLRDLALSAMRDVASAESSPGVARMQPAVGALAVLAAARMWARQRAPVPVNSDRGAVAALQPNTAIGSRSLSIRDRLEAGSLRVVFVAGLLLATPPIEYVAVMIAILASTATAASQLSAALTFTVVAFTVVEVPLISYLATPAKTLAVVHRLNDWISPRRHAIPAVVIGAIGVLLVITAMGKVAG